MIDRLVTDIDVSLQNGAYMSALALALTLPDTCGRAAYPSLKVGDRYKKWYDKNVKGTGLFNSPYGDDMPYLSGEVVYGLRCSFLHAATPNIDDSKIEEERCKIDKFILVIDDQGIDTGYSHVAYTSNNKVSYRELQVDIRHLCYILKTAANAYYNTNKEKFSFINCHLVDKREERKIIQKMLRGDNNHE